MQSQPWFTPPVMQNKTKCAIVIGGGLAGTSAAYGLADRGWQITLIERGEDLASEASGNPVGILTPLITHRKDPIGEFYFSGFEYSLTHLKTLQALGSEVYFNNTGVLELSRGKIDKNITNCVIPEGNIVKLSSHDATRICGAALSSNALYMEQGGFVSPKDLCRANISASGKNIHTMFSKSVLSIARSGDGWAVYDRSACEIARAPVVIIANAADAASFGQCSWLPIQAVRGQLTYLPAMGLGIHRILCYDGGYITPEINGFHCVGATYSHSNASAEVSMADNIINLENLRRVLDIGNVELQTLQGRVSFRASVIDRRPVIGAVPDIAAYYNDYADLQYGRKKNYPVGKYLEGLYIAAGFGSRGLSSCGISGELLAAMINNEALPLPSHIVHSLHPARFIIKRIKTRGLL